MADYISKYTGEEIDSAINHNNIQDERLDQIENKNLSQDASIEEIQNSISGIQNKNSTQDENIIKIQNKLDTIEEGANNFALTDNCIKTSYIQNNAITVNKLAPEVAESLASIKLYQGTLLASNWVDDLADTEDYSLLENKWKWEKFASHTCNSSIRETLSTLTPTAINYYNDGDITSAGAYGDSYTARCTTYLYCPEAVEYSCQVETDDAGAVYINGEFIKTLVSCEITNITILFQQGVNCLEVFYTEGSGADGWKFYPDMSTRIGYEFSAMYAVPAHTYYQTITPTCLDGTSQISTSTLFSPGMILNGDIPMANLRDKINMGHIHGNSDGTIKVTYNHTIPIESDIILYWFGKTI